MVNNVNTVILSGNVARDAELRQTNGGAVLSFRIANNVYSKNGENNQYTNWFDCVMFGNRAEKIAPYIVKGVHVTVTGQLRQSSWQAQDGSKRSKVETIVNELELGRGRDNGEQTPARVAPYQSGGASAYANDDIPF